MRIGRITGMQVHWNDWHRKIAISTEETSQTPQPNKIPVADANGRLNDWVDGGGSGDMLKSVYDKNYNGIVDKAERIEGISNSDIQSAITLKHDGVAQDNIIATKITLAEVKADEDISDAVNKKHFPSVLGTKQIDETDIADGKVIAYNQAEDKLKYIVAGGSGNGDMLKSVYDMNDDGIVDNADVILNNVQYKWGIENGRVYLEVR